MSHPSSDQFSGIFICYRREDSPHAGRLCDKLAAHFGEDKIFRDIDTIPSGLDYVDVIEKAVGSCQVLLAIIGPNWLTHTTGSKRSLDNPRDFVRLEIVAALDREIRVVPVLVREAEMPRPDDLPDELKRLARRQAIELSENRWHKDVNELIEDLEKILPRLEAATEKPHRPLRLPHTHESPNDQPKPTKFTLALMIAGAALVLLVGVGLWIKSSRNSLAEDHQATTTARPCTVKVSGNTTVTDRTMRNGLGMEFVLVKRGKFDMGSDTSEYGWDELKPHAVSINYDFYIGKFEVTQEQWQAVMCCNPSYFKDCGGTCPVDSVSWDDVKRFIENLERVDSEFSYRLPSEAEWEYACRADTKSDYRHDMSEADQERFQAKRKNQAWFDLNSDKKTHSVGQKQLNQWDLADMLGNVWEWCADPWHEKYDGAPTDGSVWNGDESSRVLRGGAFDSNANFMRPAKRLSEEPDKSDKNKGFRLVARRRRTK